MAKNVDDLPGATNLARGLAEPNLAGLDGMRAIAAFLVVFYHFGVPFVSGGIGVLMFFVLSGFLITWLLIKENDEFETVSLSKFYTRRSLRIFPAFYTYAAILLAMLIARHRSIVVPQAMAALFYFNDYYQALKGDPNTGFSHTWSLAIEEQFYLLWPLAFLLLRRDYKRMCRVLVGSIFAIWIYREVMVFGLHADQGYIYEAFDTRADHLLIGCLLAVALRAGQIPRFFGWISDRSWAAVITAGLLALSSWAELTYGHAYRDGVSFIVTPVLTALWIPQLIALRDTALWGWTSLSWVRYLGRISYSIYLYQQVLIGVPKKLLAHQGTVVTLTATVALVVAVASLSYFFVEKPFLKLKARFGHAGRRAAPVAASL